MIVIIGKNGQLATELAAIAEDNAMICLGRQEIDLLDAADITKKLNQYSPTAVINASAYTAVDKAESESEEAFALNESAVSNLGHYCAGKRIPLVHVSTDYVFDGNYSSPIKVDAPRRPLGVYGASKAAGEAALESIQGLDFCIIRTAWVYSCHGNNFVKTMLRLMSEKPQLGIVCDQIGSPTWAAGLAQACLYAAINRVTGIHHWTDQGVASWYDFAIAIQRHGLALGLLDSAIPVNPIESSAFPTPAKRPAYSVLDKTTLSTAFAAVPSVHWDIQLGSMLSELATFLTNNGKL